MKKKKMKKQIKDLKNTVNSLVTIYEILEQKIAENKKAIEALQEACDIDDDETIEENSKYWN